MTRGRPSRLPEVQARIVQLVTAGVYPEVAAGACGIARSTYFEWIRRGTGVDARRKATRELVAFAQAIQQAIDTSECRLVLKLSEYIEGRRKGKRKPWVKSRISMAQTIAMQWMLARRFPERWAHHGVTELGADASGPEASGSRVTIQVVHGRVDDGAHAEQMTDPDGDVPAPWSPARRTGSLIR